MPALDLDILVRDVLGLLIDGVVSDPQKFIGRCSVMLNEFKTSIPDLYPRGMVETKAFELLCYLELKKELGQAMAYEIMRVVFLVDGLARMNVAFDTLRGRSFEKLTRRVVDYNRELGLAFEIREQSQDRFELRLRKCWFWELCCELGIPEATTLVCQVDNAFFSSYLPDEVRFSHGTPCARLVDGAESCHFVFTRILGLSPQRPYCPGK